MSALVGSPCCSAPGRRRPGAGAGTTPSPEAGIQAGAPRTSGRSPSARQRTASPLSSPRSIGDGQRLQRVIGSANIPLVHDFDPGDAGGRERFLAAHAEEAEVQRPASDRAVLQSARMARRFRCLSARRSVSHLLRLPPAARAEILDRHISAASSTSSRHSLRRRRTAFARTHSAAAPFQSLCTHLFLSPGEPTARRWQPAPGEPDSPLSPLLAQRAREASSTRAPRRTRRPYPASSSGTCQNQEPDTPAAPSITS